MEVLVEPPLADCIAAETESSGHQHSQTIAVTLHGKIRHIEAAMKEADDPKWKVPVYSERHIVVRDLGFDPATGQQRLAIDENHAGAGLRARDEGTLRADPYIP
jgi:hypothetical protein